MACVAAVSRAADRTRVPGGVTVDELGIVGMHENGLKVLMHPACPFLVRHDKASYGSDDHRVTTGIVANGVVM